MPDPDYSVEKGVIVLPEGMWVGVVVGIMIIAALVIVVIDLRNERRANKGGKNG